MIIEFLFSEIKDKSKIYIEECQKTRSIVIDDVIDVINSEYVGKEYCKNSMDSICNNLSGLIKGFDYKGAIDQIANESFEIVSNITTYTVNCKIETFDKTKSRMLIRIISAEKNENIKLDEKEIISNDSDIPVGYDLALEKLKLEIKNEFRADWENCIWIKDEQSELLCSLLYPYIFRAENKIRALANKILIFELGNNWIKSPGLEKYAESCKNLSDEFRSKEPAFKDVDDVFISMTLETLFEVIQKGEVYESPFQLTQEQFNELLSIISKGNKENSLNWIKKKRLVKKKLWEDIFKVYFSDTENSQQIITDFILNRNHIAHNKPITSIAYKKMKKSFEDFDQMVTVANQKFDESVQSEEFYLTVDILNEEAFAEEQQKEYEQRYFRERVSGETGVEILQHDEILDLFIEKAESLYQELNDKYYWDDCFKISSMYAIEKCEEWQTLLTIICNANEEHYIDVQVCIIIDDSMDGDSVMLLRYVHHAEKNIIYSTNDNDVDYAINYHNGNAYEDQEEGKIELCSESALDESEQSQFIEALDDAIEELNPYERVKTQMEESAIRDGGERPVADFECFVCGKNGVSISEEFYKLGHCCYCGTDNEIKTCQRCGEAYVDGDSDFCENCLSYIEKD